MKKQFLASGTCGAQGDNLTWTLTDDGTLTISGKGDMEDASYRHSALLALRAKSLAALGSPLSQLR